jgi:bifunctional DNA-binding transcriptional regulator/antitoxin component of YhaV-PrlF toxin-antitoxin module
MLTSTLSQNGQTTIPAKIRQFLQIAPRDKLVYHIEGSRVILENSASCTDALYGSFQSNRTPPTKAQLRAARHASLKQQLER